MFASTNMTPKDVNVCALFYISVYVHNQPIVNTLAHLPNSSPVPVVV